VQCPAHYSRHIHTVKLDKVTPESTLNWLLGSESEPLRGSVLLSASDAGSQLLAENMEELKTAYLLDTFSPDATFCMLNKLDTYRIASEAGVLTPKYWILENYDQLPALRNELVYPLIVKPEHTYKFLALFRVKFRIVENYDQLRQVLDSMAEMEIKCMLVELIPGPDSNLYNFHTYIDEHDTPLYEYTKGILRRYPVLHGPACYHITVQKPEIRDQALRFFSFGKVQGVTNVEFKYDIRDKLYKLIECNIRFVAPTGMIITPGRDNLDLAKFVYCRVIGKQVRPPANFMEGDRMWFPMEDFLCFLELRKANQLSFIEWFKSALKFPKLPYFQWTDPGPSLYLSYKLSRRIIMKIVRTIFAKRL
jgi:D-aspartate ligase